MSIGRATKIAAGILFHPGSGWRQFTGVADAAWPGGVGPGRGRVITWPSRHGADLLVVAKSDQIGALESKGDD